MGDFRSIGLFATISVLVVVVFLVDLAAPLGSAIWSLYLLPIIFSYTSRQPWLPPVAAAGSIALTVAGFLLDQSGDDPRITLINRSVGSVVVVVLGAFGYYFVRNRLWLRRSDWLQEGQVAVSRAAEGEQGIETIADRILAVLAGRLGARAAAFYARDGEGYRRVAGYGLPPEAGVPDWFGPGGGHLWRCATEGRITVLDDLPEGALPYASALVRARSAQAVLAPADDGGRVNGVLEFGLDRPAGPNALALLERIADPVGIAIRSAADRRRLRELLDETLRQSEEIRAHSEELAAANEELEEQTRALQDSQRRLEAQQSELEGQNTRLESQAEELERQRDELARSRRALEDQARRLERESRYKSEFVANMSHELRTPLNALLIMARLLADNRGRNLSEEQVGWAETIESSGKDLLALINDILDLSKIESGTLDLTPAPVEAQAVADRLVRAMAPQAQGRGLGLRSEIPPDLPVIHTDSGRLEQVLRNFLSNALKFTENGEIVLTASAEGEGLAFSVRDTGIGIAAEDQETIFAAFRQADGTISRRYGGTGLGLSISRELAGLLGGAITVDSAPGRGSTFTLHLPARLEVADAATPRPRTRPVAPARDRATGPGPVPDDRAGLTAEARTLLVIEDDPAFARILTDLAHELHFQCIAAGTSEDGVLAARQYLPDAIILDIGLPDHTGLSVLDRLKRDSRTRHIPVHIVSVSDYSREALAQGAISYLLKPVKREELVQALKSIEARLDQRMRRVLIVEDDPAQLEGLKALLASKDVETTGAATAAEGLDRMKAAAFDCLVLDMTLPDASGFDLLESLDADESAAFPPVIVYTARALSEEEELRLRRYSKSIIIKGAKSPERLIDEVTLFLHQVVSDLPERQQRMLAASLNRDALLDGRRILVVEDDIRNVYALTGVFEPHGAEVQIARNGREALEALDRMAEGGAPRIDLVLMDVMMPEMDGLTATREIRKRPEWRTLPIIMLTAKAMADDQEQCLAAGANDYLAKPLDVDKLLSLARVWMPR